MSMRGWPTWGTALQQGKGDAALSWEGLRAQWKGQGLDFDYILGRDFSKLPANSFVIRKADFEDAAKKEVYGRYFQGLGSRPRVRPAQSARRDADRHGAVPRPFLADDAGSRDRVDDAACQRLCAAAWDERKKWGFHLMESWQMFFDIGREIGQITGDFKVEDVVKNDLVDAANSFDAAKVKADADGFALSDDYKGVDVEAISRRHLIALGGGASGAAAHL